MMNGNGVPQQTFGNMGAQMPNYMNNNQGQTFANQPPNNNNNNPQFNNFNQGNMGQPLQGNMGFIPPGMVNMGMQQQVNNLGMPQQGNMGMPQQPNKAFIPPGMGSQQGNMNFIPPGMGNPNMGIPPQPLGNPNNFNPAFGNIPGPSQFNYGFKPSSNQLFTYINKRWTISDKPSLKGQYLQKKNEFLNTIVNNQPIPQSMQFVLSDQRSIWIKKQEFADFQLLGCTAQNLIDLKVIYEITKSYQGVENALFFCYYPYIELDENLEMTQFLLACLLLSIDHPFKKLYMYFNNYLDNSEAHVLKTGDDIFDLMIFMDQCKEKQELNMYSSLFETDENNQDQHAISKYLKLLLSKNPYFYNTPDGYSERIKQLSYESFISNILHYVGGQLIPQNVQYIHISQVETIYKLVQFYCLQDSFSNPQEQIDQVFSIYYTNFIEQKLTEEDRIDAIKFMPNNSENLISQLKKQYQQIQELKQREKAYLKVLIAQRCQNVALSAYKDQFKQAFQIVSGEELSQEIENLITQELLNMQNNNYN